MAKANQWVCDELPFVVYKFPNDLLLRGIFQENAEVKKINDYGHRGFVFAPFDQKGGNILITGTYGEEAFVNSKANVAERGIGFLDQGKERHMRLVKRTIEEIKTGTLQKVVLSRCIHASTKKKPNEIIGALLHKYADAFCYWWYHPSIGMWFGATPEQLLKYQKGVFLTTSLAGTLPVIGHEGANWTNKEREEQQMVTRFIKQSLDGKLNNIAITEAKNHRAGKLWHLKSDIKGEMDSFAALGDILGGLHPTPAVCGLPKQEAFDFILRHEGYDREYYAGYLGPLNIDNKESANFFVNLRCLKYYQGRVQVFVGGGITALSNPDQEWNETQFKSRTILEVL